MNEAQKLKQISEILGGNDKVTLRIKKRIKDIIEEFDNSMMDNSISTELLNTDLEELTFDSLEKKAFFEDELFSNALENLGNDISDLSLSEVEDIRKKITELKSLLID